MKTRRYRPLAPSLLSAVSLGMAACCTTATAPSETGASYATDVAYVMVTPEPPIPWFKVQPGIAPGFTSGGQALLNVVAPDTATTQQKIYDALTGQVAVGLPTSITTQTLTNTVSTSTSSTTPLTSSTSTTTTSNASGAVPSSLPSLATSGVTTTISGSGPMTATSGRSIDPLLQYNVAASLNQEIVLLNQGLSELEADNPDYVPFVVRVRVSIAPMARDLPYDGFIDLSMVPSGEATLSATSKAPIMLPLLVSDSIESVLNSNAEENVRSMALGIQATIDAVGLNAQTQKIHDQLNALAGRAYNSTLLVGRIGRNAIRVRLGASAEAIPKSTALHYALQAESHIITSLVLIPSDELKTSHGAGWGIKSRAVFRDSRSGVALADDPTFDCLYHYKVGLVLDEGLAQEPYDSVIEKLIGFAKDNNRKGFNEEMKRCWRYLATDDLVNFDDVSNPAWEFLKHQYRDGGKDLFNSDSSEDAIYLRVRSVLNRGTEFVDSAKFEQLRESYRQGDYAQFKAYVDSFHMTATDKNFRKAVHTLQNPDDTAAPTTEKIKAAETINAAKTSALAKAKADVTSWLANPRENPTDDSDRAFRVWNILADYAARSVVAESPLSFGINGTADYRPRLPHPKGQDVYLTSPASGTLQATLSGGFRMAALHTPKAILTLTVGQKRFKIPSALPSVSADGSQITLSFAAPVELNLANAEHLAAITASITVSAAEAAAPLTYKSIHFPGDTSFKGTYAVPPDQAVVLVQSSDDPTSFTITLGGGARLNAIPDLAAYLRFPANSAVPAAGDFYSVSTSCSSDNTQVTFKYQLLTKGANAPWAFNAAPILHLVSSQGAELQTYASVVQPLPGQTIAEKPTLKAIVSTLKADPGGNASLIISFAEPKPGVTFTLKLTGCDVKTATVTPAGGAATNLSPGPSPNTYTINQTGQVEIHIMNVTGPVTLAVNDSTGANQGNLSFNVTL